MPVQRADYVTWADACMALLAFEEDLGVRATVNVYPSPWGKGLWVVALVCERRSSQRDGGYTWLSSVDTTTRLGGQSTLPQEIVKLASRAYPGVEWVKGLSAAAVEAEVHRRTSALIQHQLEIPQRTAS